MNNKINLFILFGYILLIVLGCNVQSDGDKFSISTEKPGISELKFGRNKDANPKVNSFAPKDTIFVRATVSNTSGKSKVKMRILYDDVRGAESGALLNETIIDLSGDGSPFVHFSSKSGLDAGRYRAEAILLEDDGKTEIDRKSGTFMISD